MQPALTPTRKHEQRLIDLQDSRVRAADIYSMKRDIVEIKDTISQLSNTTRIALGQPN